MAYTEAQKRASRKYNENNYERVYVFLPLGEKSRWRSAADAAGVSINEFIRQCVNSKLQEQTSCNHTF